MLTTKKPEWRYSNVFFVNLTLSIANALSKCFTIDFEQVYFSLYETNYLPALASKGWSKRTFRFDKVRGAILHALLICSSLESEDTLNNVSLNSSWHIIHLLLYNGNIERMTFLFGGEQHSSVIVKPTVRSFILDSFSFNTLLQWLWYEYLLFNRVVFAAPFKFPILRKRYRSINMLPRISSDLFLL